MSSLECHKLARSRAWACVIWPGEQRLQECFSVMESHFPTEILARPGKIFEIWLLHVAERVFFLKVPNLHMNSQWAKKTLCAKVISQEEKMCWISCTISFLLSIFLRTVDVAPSVNFLWSPCPWKACDVFFGVSQTQEKSSMGLWDMTPRTEAAGVFFHDRESFSDLDYSSTGEDLGNPRVAHCSWTCLLS
jgi:hypothetical protein